MKKLFQRLFIALCVAALPLYAIADYTATQGAGTTIFAFLCQSTKVCPAHVLINSSATEIMTSASPGFVSLTNSNVTVVQPTAASLNATVVQPTAASLNATVVGTGTFATQVNGFTSWAGGTLGAMSNYGSSPGAVLVPGHNAFVTNTVTVSPSNVYAVNAIQSGTWTVQPGNTPNSTPWLFSPSTGGNTAAVKAASTAPLATDPALVVALSPNGLNPNGLTTSNASAPVVIASDQVAVAVKNSLQTTGGITMLTALNLLTTVNAVKASGGQVYKLYCYNPNASVAYIQMFNIASGSVTLGTSKPSASYGIPATNAAGFALADTGDQFATAISMAATTTATGSTPPSTGVDCNVSFN